MNWLMQMLPGPSEGYFLIVFFKKGLTTTPSKEPEIRDNCVSPAVSQILLRYGSCWGTVQALERHLPRFAEYHL